jgi:dihydroorotate dehydrogenase electron transfer subunit
LISEAKRIKINGNGINAYILRILYKEKMMKYFLNAKVRENKALSEGWHALRIECPEIAESAVPGQFVQLRAWEGASPLLARPIGVAGIPAPGEILLWIQRVGGGTRLITGLRAGDEISVTGPLGRGFTMPAAGETVYFAAGCVGAAPLRFVAEKQPSGVNSVFFYGAGTQCDTVAPLTDPVISGMEVVVTTDDGTCGEKGFVTDALRRAVNNKKPDRILACGPMGMLKAVAALAAEAGAPCEVSMESHMGCGLGACNGCVAPVKDAVKQYAHVCTDGPVFDSNYIDWEAF